jgi:hypothetical protein
VTVEAAYTDAHALPLGLPFAGIPAGANCRMAYLQAGPGAGLNYLVRGHDFKVTADWSRSPRGSRPATSAITLQTQVGF